MAQSIWIIAGEESGDAYGARLAAELRRQCAGLTLRGMGGRAMAAAGVEILIDSSELGVVGFIEVLGHLRTILHALTALVQRAERERPDAVVLIDYPGFNLRLARRLHALGIPVVYYVSPQVWAWKRGRRHQMAAWCRRLLCIFPFEPAHFADTGLEVRFVGHPLLEILAGERETDTVRDANLVLLLPGSRRGEVLRLLPRMLATAAELRRRRPELRFVVPVPRPAVAEVARRCVEESALGLAGAITIETGRTRHWLQAAAAGLATSGTVTMEAAILGLPVVSVYRLSWLTYALGRVLVHGIPFFTIVNLVAGREVYQEFLQGQVTAGRLVPAVEAILPGGARRAEVLRGMSDAVQALGPTAAVSATAARLVLEVAAGPDGRQAGPG
jgi:lipid-A-disaccharide synthase